MERNIPHVLDIFAHSPGAKRRARERREPQAFSSKLKEQKNPGSDSAVSLGSSDEDENERNISKYFDYLDYDTNLISTDDSKTNKIGSKNWKNEDKKSSSKNKSSCTDPKKNNDIEKEIRHIERHLSMKKTIRKKMMRDLQQAFVENPGECTQDPEKIAPEKKSNINIENLTISKKRLSKSEHSFLEMLKDEENQLEKKERKLRNLDAFKEPKGAKRVSKLHPKEDDDSGNDSPTRESSYGKTKSNENVKLPSNPRRSEKEEKKTSFWKRLTGKSKKR